jgi:hypothetical protein
MIEEQAIKVVKYYLKYSAVSIFRVPVVRVSVSSEPTLCSHVRFYAGCRIQLNCVISVCTRVFQLLP